MTTVLSYPAPDSSPDVPAADTPDNPLVKQAPPPAPTGNNVAATGIQALQATGVAATPADAAQPALPESGQCGSPANGWSPAGIPANGWARLRRGLKITDALPDLTKKWTVTRWA